MPILATKYVFDNIWYTYTVYLGNKQLLYIFYFTAKRLYYQKKG